MESLAQFSVYLLIFTSSGMLLFRHWRLCLLMLVFQYIGMFILISLSWSLEMAVVKLLTGWVSAAVLGFSMANVAVTANRLAWKPDIPHSSWGSETLFHLLMIGLALLVVFSAVPIFLNWEAGIYPQQVYGGFVLMAISTLQISLTQRPFRLFLGLLSFLSAVEIIYAAVEGSVLVSALFAVIQLSLALVGSYLIVGHTFEES